MLQYCIGFAIHQHESGNNNPVKIYVSLLDFKEILKSKTQYLLSRSPHFRDSGQDFID